MKQMLRWLTAFGLGGVTLLICLNLGVLQSPAAAPDYQAELETGLQYFRELVSQQLTLIDDFDAALASGDQAQAEAAYINARPPYEEIEVLAADFEAEDTNIDARPYAFEAGEADPEFKSFHRIEALIFRDRDLVAARSYIPELKASVESLNTKLADVNNFSAASHWNGMITLATEIPAKKISSEEETWSDQSILIFAANWQGIYSQYQPFAQYLSTDLANAVDSAYEDCMKTVAPYRQAGQAATTPYSQVDVAARGEISRAAYPLRDALIAAQAALGLA